MSTSLFIYRIHSARNILSSSLAEKGFQRIITSSKSLVRWHLSVGLDSVLKAVKLPAAITSLNTGLASVIRDTGLSSWRVIAWYNNLYRYKHR